MNASTPLAVATTLGLIVATASGGTGGGSHGKKNPTPVEGEPGGDDVVQCPPTIEVVGVVRDFEEMIPGANGGHPDFERQPDHGFGLYVGNVAPQLGADDKPVFTGNGHKINEQWRDSSGRPICYRLYRPDDGDSAGVIGQADSGGVTSAASFRQWYRDEPGINMSALLPITFHRLENGHYVFDDTMDEQYSDLGGFFPIEDQLFGNPGGTPDRNFHFTFELQMEFQYDAEGQQFFKFIGDDDVWVFINRELVIDLGGVHSALEQHVDLDRLGLVDGETYPMHFFFAERHRTQSNFRIETNIPFEAGVVQTVSKAYD